MVGAEIGFSRKFYPEHRDWMVVESIFINFDSKLDNKPRTTVVLCRNAGTLGRFHRQVGILAMVQSMSMHHLRFTASIFVSKIKLRVCNTKMIVVIYPLPLANRHCCSHLASISASISDKLSNRARLPTKKLITHLTCTLSFAA